MGSHTKHGDYKIDPRKVRTYVVPEQLKDCRVRGQSLVNTNGMLMERSQLTPFVTDTFKTSKRKFTGYPEGPLSGQRYLDQWKRENGSD